MKDFKYTAIRLHKNTLFVLDQRQLPQKEVWLKVKTPDEMCEHISTLCVRGAPLIAIAAACSLTLFAKSKMKAPTLLEVAKKLKKTRPTAVNLTKAIDYIMKDMNDKPDPEEMEKRTEQLIKEEVKMCENIAQWGVSLIQKGEGLLTHCNTGSLATPGIGTALGIIRKAHQEEKNIHTYVTETRPLLQGARLTAWELKKENIPYTLICDSMTATLMQSGKIQRVLVGADRIAMNGDFANKIGTYGLATQAHYHQLPFHSAAPTSTLDFSCKKGTDIPIEQRPIYEIEGFNQNFKKIKWAPKNNQTFNPAFDITPATLITSFILDTGIYTTEEITKLKFFVNSTLEFYGN